MVRYSIFHQIGQWCAREEVVSCLSWLAVVSCPCWLPVVSCPCWLAVVSCPCWLAVVSCLCRLHSCVPHYPYFLWQLTMCIVHGSLTAYHVHSLWQLTMCMVFDSLPCSWSLTAYHVHGGRLCVSSFLCITVSGFLVSCASLCLGF